jgi:hypothetical protein
MARRRRRAEPDDGLISDLIDAIFTASRDSPRVGIGITVFSLVLGTVFNVGAKGGANPMLALVGVLCYLIAMACAALALIGWVGRSFHGRCGAARTLRGLGQALSQPACSSPAAAGTAAAAIEPRDGSAFEQLVAELYRRAGYAVEVTGRHGQGTDGGVDLVLRVPPERARDGELAADAGADVLVQCKDYAKGWVSVDQMRAFFGAVCGWSATATTYATRARRGVFVTTSFFSQDARAFAEANGIELADGRLLAARLTAAGLPVPYDVPPPEPDAPKGRPTCPRCRVPMTPRQPGPTDDWAAFWGCPNYRTRGCRQTVKVH